MMYGGGGNRGMTLRMGEESSRAVDRERGGGRKRILLAVHVLQEGAKKGEV